MIFSQPTPPPPMAVPVPSPEVTIVETSPTVTPLPRPSVSPASIVVPETISSPQPSPSPSLAPEISPPAPEVRPTATPSPSPSAVSQPLPSQQRPVNANSQPSKTAENQRRQILDQKLTELFNKERPAREAQSRQVLIELILKYARSGDFDKARRLAKDSVLPLEVQTALLREISEIQAKELVLAPKKKNSNTLKSSPMGALPAPNGITGGNLASSGQPGNYSVSSFYSPRYTGPDPQLSTYIKHGLLALLFPLGIPAPITSVFGWRIHPISGVPRFHQGIDIGAPIGTPVIAAHTGKVELADILSGYGLAVILRHTDNIHSTLYGHLSQIFVQPGQTVKQGTVIALVGDTGNSTGPHLHFEVQQWTDQGWVAIDPINELRQTSTVAVQPSAIPSEQTIASLPRLSALPPVPTVPLLSGLPTVPTLVPLSDNNNELLANTPFAGLVNPSVTEEMGLIFPFALSAPIAPGLGWAVYPLISQLTETAPEATRVGTESMQTVVVPARLPASPSAFVTSPTVSSPTASIVPSQSRLVPIAAQTRPQSQAVALRSTSPEGTPANWSPDIRDVKLPSLKTSGN